MKMKIGIGILILAIGAGFAGWWMQRKPEIHWRAAAVERGPIQVSVTATGTLQAVTTVLVGTQVSGTVSALYADFNSQVKKGQVVARIDTTLLYASLQDAQSGLASATAQQYKADADLKRMQPLFDKNLVSQSDLDAAVVNAKVAEGNLQASKAGLQRARINLRYATIVSPIDGIVLSRAVDIGQTVAASFNTPTLFTIAGDLRKMQILSSVDEADIGQVKVGQNASFTVDAYPDGKFTGVVSQIRLQPIVSSNVVTYNVMIDVENPDLKLMPGMTANLTLTIDHKEDVLLVPAAALRFQPPRPTKSNSDSTRKHTGEWKKGGAGGGSREGFGKVFILQNGKPKFVKVKVGLSDGTKTEVEGELDTGDSVVTGMISSETGTTAAKPFGMDQSQSHGGGGRGMR